MEGYSFIEQTLSTCSLPRAWETEDTNGKWLDWNMNWTLTCSGLPGTSVPCLCWPAGTPACWEAEWRKSDCAISPGCSLGLVIFCECSFCFGCLLVLWVHVRPVLPRSASCFSLCVTDSFLHPGLSCFTFLDRERHWCCTVFSLSLAVRVSAISFRGLVLASCLCFLIFQHGQLESVQTSIRGLLNELDWVNLKPETTWSFFAITIALYYVRPLLHVPDNALGTCHIPWLSLSTIINSLIFQVQKVPLSLTSEHQVLQFSTLPISSGWSLIQPGMHPGQMSEYDGLALPLSELVFLLFELHSHACFGLPQDCRRGCEERRTAKSGLVWFVTHCWKLR